MKNINIRKHYYHFKHRVLTMNNIVIAVAVVIGVGWAWGSIEMMQRNYGLQKDVDAKRRELKLAELLVETRQYEQNYYQSSEYKELAVRDRLGLADPGEKVLILPANSKRAKSVNTSLDRVAVSVRQPSPFEQWMNFLFGGSRRDLQD